MTTITKSFNSLIEFIQLQTRERHPSGSFDRAGRFYLSDCPTYIREPSKRYPLSQMQHGRTLEYVLKTNRANEKEEIDTRELKKLLNRVAKATKGQSLTKLNVTERTEVLTEINKQLKKNSKEYKNWLKSFTADELDDLKLAVLAQIKK